MLRIILAGCILLYCIQTKAQVTRTETLPPFYVDSSLARFKRAINNYDRLYSCRRTTPRGRQNDANLSGSRAFDTLFKPILSNVFIGSNDLVQDGPASSFTQDPEKGTLSINFSMFTNPERWRLINLGVFSKATDGVFGIYSTGAWSSEIGFNIGYSSIRTRSRYFDPEQCDSLVASGSRRRFYLGMLSRIGALAQQRTTVVTRHQVVKDSLDYYWNSSSTISNEIENYNRLSAEFKILDSVKKKIEQATPDSTRYNDTLFYENLVDSFIAEFEIKNDIYTGYYLRWWTIRGSLSNNAVSLNTDSLPALLKASYKAKNIAKLSVGWNMSWQSNSKNRLRFFRFGADLGLRNFADHPTVKKPGVRFDVAKGGYTVYNKNATYLADYDDLRPNIFTFEPALYFSYFPSKFFGMKHLDKVIGWDVRIDSRIPFKKPDVISNELYPTIYTVATGPVFRLKAKDDISKGTVGVEVGVIDAPYNDNAWRFFGAKLRVGVPFSALIK